MIDKKKELTDEERIIIEECRDASITDSLLRITAVENLLMRKGLITEEEIKEEIIVLSSFITKAVSEKLMTLDNITQPALSKWVEEFGMHKKDKNQN